MTRFCSTAAAVACILILHAPASAQDAPFSNGGITLLAGDDVPPPEPQAETETLLPPARESRPLGDAIVEPVAAVETPPAAAKRLAGVPVGEIIRVGGALAVVIGLIVAARLVMRRSGVAGGGRASGVLEIIGRYPLGKGHHLLLVKLARRVLLVHQGGGNMTTLSEVVDPDEVAALLARIESGSRGAAAAKFGDMLRRYQRDHGGRGRWSSSMPAGRADLPVPEVVDLTHARRRVRA